MAYRRLNPRLAKKHRSYSVAEAARLFRVHRNTVRYWIRKGLPTVTVPGGKLILGVDLSDHLSRQRAARKVRCPPDTLYCIRCKVPKRPAGDETDCAPSKNGRFMNRRGICPDCGLLMYRRMKRNGP
jgi:hypothetical protein